jgi:hypothetical protein
MSDPLFWLYADNYRTYNVEVARKLGSIHAAIFLSEIASRYDYLLKFYRQNGELEKQTRLLDGWFYCKIEDIEERTALTRKNQDTAIITLESFGLIEKKVMDSPPKRFFKINKKKILEFFCGGQIDLPEPDKLNCPNRSNQNDRNGQMHIYNEPKEEPNKNTPLPPKGEMGVCSSCSSKKNSKKDRPPDKKSYRENVHLSEEEHEKLMKDYGKEKLEKMLDLLDAYKGSTGKKYKSDYHTLLPAAWVSKRVVEEDVKSKRKFAPESNDEDARRMGREISENSI